MYMVYLINGNSSLIIHDYEPSSRIKALGKIKQAINSIDSLQLTLYPGNPGYSSVYPLKSRILVLSDRGEQIFSGRVLKPNGSMDSSGIVKRTFVCEGELGYLCDTVQGYNTANTAEFFFRSVLTNHNAQVGSDKQISLGNITITKDNHRHTWSYVTSFKAITDYVNEYGGEFRLRYSDGDRYLDYTDLSFTSASDTPIELSVNMISVGYTADPTKIASGVFAAGAKLTDDGTSAERLELQSVIWDNDLIALYGKVVACETWDDITTAANLYARASAWLQDQSSEIRQFTATAAQLYEISYDFDDFEVGTTYPIRNSLIALDDTVRCVSKTIDINDPTQTTLTFGDRYTTIAQAIANTSTKSQQIDKIESSVGAMDASISTLRESTSGLAEQIAAIDAEIDDLYSLLPYQSNYSTDEHRVGRWLDNRYVYEKTYVVAPLADGTVRSVSVDLSIDQLKEVVESRGQLLGAGFSRPLECMPLDSSGGADEAEATSYTISSTAITVTNGTADRSADKAYITLRYTKLHDTPVVIYGWHIDPTISDPDNAITYLANAIGKTPAAMGSTAFDYGDWENAFFMPRPCMLRSDGTVAYYLDPNDYTKKTDGTASDVANPDFDGNAMMEWPKIWYKFEAGETEGEGYFYCSNTQVDDSYHCWCNINADNEIIDHFYTAIYNGTGTDKLRSLSGVLLTTANGSGGITVSQDMEKADANDAGKGWCIDVLSDRLLINALLVLIGKSLDTKAVFGNGIGATDEAIISELKSSYCTGTANDKGLFWGDISGNNAPVKVFGMENWWGCTFRNIAGQLYIHNSCYIKLTSGTADGSSANGYSFSSTNGYIFLGNFSPISSGYIQKMKFSQYGYFPITVSISNNGYWCNWMASWGGYFLQRALYAGQDSDRLGAFEIDISSTSSYSAGISSCLSCKPVRAT